MVDRARKALFLREMPTALVREAKAVAARRGQTLTTVVAEALSRSLGVEDGGAPSDLERDMEWFAAEHPRLVRRHADEYVAIIDRAVVDHDRDFDALARRVFATYGQRNTYMPRVTTEVVTEARLRSPRRVGR